MRNQDKTTERLRGELAKATQRVEELEALAAKHRLTENALRLSEEKFSKAFHSSPDAMSITMNADARYLEVNESYTRIVGYYREEVIGHTVDELGIWEKTQDRARLFRLLREQGAVRDFEANFVTKMGQLRAGLISVETIDIGGEPCILGIFNDITERKQVEQRLMKTTEELRNLSAHLQSVREDERLRIAREIHDELAQALTSLKMDLVWIATRLGKHEFIADKVKSMTVLVDVAVQVTRRIITELRPGLLDDLGLAAAIEWQAEEFEKMTGKCRVVCNLEEFSLDQDRATTVFRIFQEALTNVLRHAKASEVKVNLKHKADGVFLEVKDNGKGITQEQITSPKAFGLVGIRERVRFWGGKVEIKGGRSKGTTLRVIIPYERPRERKGQC